MSNPLNKRPTGQVSNWNDSSTPLAQTSFLNPYGLTLRQTITSSGSVTIPAGIPFVYVVMTGGGGGTFFGYGSRGAEVSWGWTVPQSTCIIGAGTTGAGGYTRYGHIIAVGGRGNSPAPTNYWGIPGGGAFTDSATPRDGNVGSNAASGNGATGSSERDGSNGGNGISGGGGSAGVRSTGDVLGGNGGSGLVGGGGGNTRLSTTTGTRTGGNGGNGLGIDGTVYIGGTGSSRTNAAAAGGGGAGIAGNGSNATTNAGGNGGLGGGGAGASDGGTSTGGAGILYIFY